MSRRIEMVTQLHLDSDPGITPDPRPMRESHAPFTRALPNRTCHFLTLLGERNVFMLHAIGREKARKQSIILVANHAVTLKKSNQIA